MTTSAIVLAAGKGTRMRSDRAKVLYEAAGRPLLGWVLAALAPVGLEDTAVVVGFGADDVVANLPGWARPALQEHQLGTGDAARVGLESLAPETDAIVVVPGDMPLLATSTIEALLEEHRRAQASATLLTARVSDPSGYGRVIRDGGRIVGIVEERDTDDDTRPVDEINTSVYVFAAEALAWGLERIDSNNDQGELYLTDVIGILAADGREIAGITTGAGEAAGVNSHGQLAAVAAQLRVRVNDRLMASGVWMLDPTRVYIDADVSVAPGARIYPDVFLEGATTVGSRAEVGPAVHARDVVIGEDARVRYSVLEGADIGPSVSVGPYAYLRPGARLAEGAKAGTFVEIKNSLVGARSKVPHLSYLGDAEVGEESNIGAGSITANYDGYDKNETKIGDRVRIGSDTMLIAPVSVGDDAFTGAGSVITKDVPPGSLAVERSLQREIPGYADRRKRRAKDDTE